MRATRELLAVLAAAAALAAVCMLVMPTRRTMLVDRFPQAMVGEAPRRGMVEIVPPVMLVSGPECKKYCYENFIMCGDHRAQTSDKLSKWGYADKIQQCRILKANCEAQC